MKTRIEMNKQRKWHKLNENKIEGFTCISSQICEEFNNKKLFY